MATINVTDRQGNQLQVEATSGEPLMYALRDLRNGVEAICGGMDEWYVMQQLQNFKADVRGPHEEDPYGYEMQPMAAALDDAQIAAAAEFASATRSPAPPATVTGDIDKGKAHYSTCAACHGVDGKGNEALGSPNLTIANDWYLVTQLKNFRSGARGSHPSDIYGMQMRASARLLADDNAINDVVAYINTLQDK